MTYYIQVTQLIILLTHLAVSSFTFTPNENIPLPRLAVFFMEDIPVAMTYTANNTPTTAKVVAIGSMNQVENCDIVSLEVYRGREQTVNISYSGFTLNDNGTVMVSKQ